MPLSDPVTLTMPLWLATAPDPVSAPIGRRPPPKDPTDGLLDPNNLTNAGVTFRLAMHACGLADLAALKRLAAADRRTFEEIWTQAMYDRCAAQGTLIAPGRHPSHPTKRAAEDEEDLIEESV